MSIEDFGGWQVLYHVPDDSLRLDQGLSKSNKNGRHLQSMLRYWFALEIRHSSNHKEEDFQNECQQI